MTTKATQLPKEVRAIAAKMFPQLVKDNYTMAEVEKLLIAVSQHYAKTITQTRQSMIEKYGDFRKIEKHKFGQIKYGRTLRFFETPHTKHKKGDDDSTI